MSDGNGYQEALSVRNRSNGTMWAKNRLCTTASDTSPQWTSTGRSDIERGTFRLSSFPAMAVITS